MNEVYQLAKKQRKNDQMKLLPKQALFATVMQIISNETDEGMEKLLGLETSEQYDELVEMIENQEYDYFWDVAQKVLRIPSKEIRYEVRPVIGQEHKLVYIKKKAPTKEEFEEFMDKSDNFKVTHRLIAAKLQEKYFPVTSDFVKEYIFEN